MLNKPLLNVLCSAALIAISGCASQAVLETEAPEPAEPIYDVEPPWAYLLMHPDLPELNRLVNQVRLQSELNNLPEDLADYVVWLMQQQLKLSENEKNMQMLSQANSQQQRHIQWLQKELSEKIAQLHALTAIEQKLNEQQPNAERSEAQTIEGDNND